MYRAHRVYIYTMPYIITAVTRYSLSLAFSVYIVYVSKLKNVALRQSRVIRQCLPCHFDDKDDIVTMNDAIPK